MYHIKNRYIGNFMYMRFAAALFCILYCPTPSDVSPLPPPSLPSPPLPSLALCTEQFRNQQGYEVRKIRLRYIKIVLDIC
jgi:hypothetical protein